MAQCSSRVLFLIMHSYASVLEGRVLALFIPVTPPVIWKWQGRCIIWLQLPNRVSQTRRLEQLKCVFSWFWRLDIPDGVASRVGLWVLSSWLADGLPSVQIPSWCLFLFLEGHQSCWITALPLWPHWSLITPSKAHLQIPAHWRLGLQHGDLEGAQFSS